MKCAVADCHNKYDSHGLCGMHNMRLKRHGDVNWVPLTKEQLFWKRVNKTSSCWLWTGSNNGHYGKFGINGIPAHRIAYEIVKGKIPEYYQIDHLCRNKLCVNPDRLGAVTAKVNIHRAQIANNIGIAKTYCPSGHPYSPNNTCIRNGGRRYCKTCDRIRALKYRNKVKELKV